MSADKNLADPDFEPTDDQLVGLSARAFAGVRQARAAALDEVCRQIDVARAAVLRDLNARRVRGER